MSTGDDEIWLADAVAELAGAVSAPLLDALATSVGGSRGDVRLESLAEVVGAGTPRARAQKLLRACAKRDPELSRRDLAIALRAAARSAEAVRREQSLELVWSGPKAADTSLRRIDQALYELIERAERRITLVTFAAYNVPKLKEALFAATVRNVALTLILESKELNDGALKVAPLHAFGQDLARRAQVYVWPMDQRPSGEDVMPAVLHAKCAIGDDDQLLMSSANLTGSALEANMELGVLVRGGRLPREAAEHFDELIRTRVLARVET